VSICLDCLDEPTKLCAVHHRTDNLVSPEDVRGLLLEEVALLAAGLHGTLLDGEHLQHFKPCQPCRNAILRLGESLKRLEAAK
jgi:hypothetical protein